MRFRDPQYRPNQWRTCSPGTSCGPAYLPGSLKSIANAFDRCAVAQAADRHTAKCFPYPMQTVLLFVFLPE